MATAFLVLSCLFWKFRIFDSGVDPYMGLGTVDLYTEVIPAARYGYEKLAQGEIPLWNPYQFCGLPFLAVPYNGILYPFHLFFLFIDTLTAVEISFVLHMLFGSFSMWLLARRLGVSIPGAACSAVTFAWSGFMIMNNSVPGIFACLNWLPLTILMLDGVLRGIRFSEFGLVVCLLSQLLLGTAEVLLHTLYAGGLFVLCRLIQMSRAGDGRLAVQRSGLIFVCGIGALLIAAPQLLPAIELLRGSVRAPGALNLEQAAIWGSVSVPVFARSAVGGVGVATVGLMPIFGLPLVLGFRRYSLVWIFALIAAVAAALLVFGGEFYRLYFSIPIVGGLFRRPMKFLDIYAFAQALLVGVAATRLWFWSGAPRRELWAHPAWLASLGITAAALLWLNALGVSYRYWLVAAGLLLGFGLSSGRAMRRGFVLCLCTLQGASLFFNVGDTHIRPLQRPRIFSKYHELLDKIGESLGDGRIFLSNWYSDDPGLMAKQGTLSRLPVTSDYEPLAPGRYGEFFRRVVGRPDEPSVVPFFGRYALSPGSHWKLMDLIGTRFYVVHAGTPLAREFMLRNHANFVRRHRKGPAWAFERPSALPRAYVVPSARVLSGPEQVLEELSRPDFDPRAEVLLEAPPGVDLRASWADAASGRARIVSYMPESVVIAAKTPAPGFLVLSDLYYPGWKAFVRNREVPIHRANYLFRAVHLEKGHSRIRFEYRPTSFRTGVLVSVATILSVCTIPVWRRIRPLLEVSQRP